MNSEATSEGRQDSSAPNHIEPSTNGAEIRVVADP